MDKSKSFQLLVDKEFEELRLATIKRCESQEEYEQVLKAFEFAKNAHSHMTRRSSEPYIIHPISVAKIVVQEIGLGYKSIVAALLHDVVEDTDYTVEDIERLFGEKVASLVDGLTKIKIAFESKDISSQAENFRRIILTLNDDVRVVLIKLADRLHNLRTLQHMPERKKDKILSETMYIFIPLAHRLGLYNMKTEMENIWLRYKEPDAYNQIQEKLDLIISERGGDIDKFIAPIEKFLVAQNYNFRILKRTKSPYSIWNKMQTKGVTFEEIYDIYAVRVIFSLPEGSKQDERAECYKIYLHISDIYYTNKQRSRDWIANPKGNGYEALHCTAMSKTEKSGQWVEVQIRTQKMNEIAEKGIAAHWRYKRDEPNSRESELDKWLDAVKDVIASTDVSALKFLDNFHDNITDSEIYVFTPKGDSKAIKKGATALDFAYYIHTEVGNTAIAAKVNYKLVPVSTRLKSGDLVEIITAESQKPQKEWLEFLKTTRAINHVVEALKETSDGDIITIGRTMLEKELEKLNVKLTGRVLDKLVTAYELNNKEELYSKLFSKVIDTKSIEKTIKKNAPNKNVIYHTLKFLNPSKDKRKEKNEQLSKLGKNQDYILEENIKEKTLNYIIADCCHPIPGDGVVAFVNDKEDVIIHKKTCSIAESLAATKGERIINAKWSKHSTLSSLARIKIVGIDRMGILSDVARLTSAELSINMRRVEMQAHDNIVDGEIDCYVRNTDDLDRLIKKLQSIKGIESVIRTDITE